MWSVIKKILFIVGIIFFLIVLGMAFQYYKANSAYTHYVIKTIRANYHSSIVEGYTDKFSYFKEETLKVYLNPRKNGPQWVHLFDVNQTLVDSVYVPLKTQKRGEDASVLGYQFEKSFEYSNNALKSGLYLWEKSAAFIVKDTSRITIVYPSNTINAYNISGGKSFYSIFTRQSPVISFQRPIFPAVSFHTNAFMKWLHKQHQYNFSYISDQDLDNPGLLRETKLLIIIGHSEYWTRKARKNFDDFVDRGGDALILSGNTMWWQVRYSDDGHQIICYKNAQDPILDSSLKTINWVSPSLGYPVVNSIGADFALGGFGRKAVDNLGGFKILVPESFVFEGTNSNKNDILKVSTKEYDGTYINNDSTIDLNKLGFYKAELLGVDNTINDYGKGNGSFIIFKKTPSSGVVINVGTADWCSDNGIGGPDSVRIQKITSNMIKGLYEQKALFKENY